MKRFFPFFILGFVLFGLSGLSRSQTSDRKNIAVIDLDNRGAMSQEEVRTLTDRLRSALVQTKAFTVLDRGKMEEILREQGFQQTGCTSLECAVEVGKLLNVEQMVTGSIGRIGRLYTIDIILIDVETSQIIKSITRDYDGEIEGLLGFMKSIANEIAGISEPPPPKEPEVGTLQIITEPMLAEVFLDDVKIGETPLKVDNIPSGQHKLKVVAEGYAPREGTITIDKGKINKFTVTLKKMYDLKIITTPTDAEVYINGKYAGRTPYYQTVIDGTRLNLIVKKKNRVDWIMNDITVTKETEITIKLKRTKIWWWLGTLAVAGGAIYYYMSNKEEEPVPELTGFPTPPGRP